MFLSCGKLELEPSAEKNHSKEFTSNIINNIGGSKMVKCFKDAIKILNCKFVS